MATSKLIEKIQKILTLSNDAGATPEEADTAFQMANKLLLQHNLTVSDVQFKIQSDGITQDTYAVEIGTVKEEGNWESTLMATLCEFNLCGCITHRTKSKREATMTIIGTKENIEVVLYLFDIARRLYRMHSKNQYNKYRKAMIESNAHLGLTELELQKEKRLAYRTVWIRSYLKGCVAGLFGKLTAQKKELTQDVTSDHSVGMELMVIDNKKQIQEYIGNEFTDLGQEKKWKIDAESKAFNQGVSDGRNIELVGAIDQKEKTKIN